MHLLKEIKIGITGSRDLHDLSKLREFIDSLPPNYTIVSGYEGRADQTAVNLAAYKGLRRITYKADWSRYGRRAGPIRNSLIIKEGITELHYFLCPYTNFGKGTADCIRQAKAAGIPVFGH